MDFTAQSYDPESCKAIGPMDLQYIGFNLESAGRCSPPPPTRVVLTGCDEAGGMRTMRLCSKLRLPMC